MKLNKRARELKLALYIILINIRKTMLKHTQKNHSFNYIQTMSKNIFTFIHTPGVFRLYESNDSFIRNNSNVLYVRHVHEKLKMTLKK